MKNLFIMLFLPIFCSAQQANFGLLKAKKINGRASFQFSEAYLLDYAMYSKNLTDSVYTKVQTLQNTEGLLINKHTDLLIQNKDSIINQISVIAKISISFNQEYMSVIKYRLIQGVNTSGIHFFIAQKVANKWVEMQKSNEISENIKAILRLKNDVFSQFEYEQTLEKYKAIDAIKAKFKDSEGILDIDKLGAYLKTKPKELEKYCDY